MPCYAQKRKRRADPHARWCGGPGGFKTPRLPAYATLPGTNAKSCNETEPRQQLQPISLILRGKVAFLIDQQNLNVI